MPFINGNVIGESQKYLKILIDNLYCSSPDHMVDMTLKNIDPKNVNCDWLPTNENDSCKNLCACWQFPEAEKFVADCSHRNLTQIPNLVGKYNNWTTELNVSGNQIKYPQSLKNDTFKHITVINLSNNTISSVSTDIFSKTLQFLNCTIITFQDLVNQYFNT